MYKANDNKLNNFDCISSIFIMIFLVRLFTFNPLETGLIKTVHIWTIKSTPGLKTVSDFRFVKRQLKMFASERA